jgi:hypothetical protein
MLLRYRRYLGLLALLLLATPLVAGLITPDGLESVVKEGRRLTPPPPIPGDWEAFVAFPDQVDRFLKDRFGLRQRMMRAYRDLTKPLLAKGNGSVLVGRDGRMFLLEDQAVRQSAGLVLRDQRVSDTADFLAGIRDTLASRGIRFLVASPPNSATIYQEDLPYWARSAGRKTEYDLLLEDLAARGVPAIDLRPALSRLRSEAPSYLMYDTHWTPRGAVAGFNAIVTADGRPDWRLDPASVLGPATTRKGGDLARMLGVDDKVSEPIQELTLPSGPKVELSEPPFATYVETSDKSGPTIMIIGDSFTIGSFAPMLIGHAGKIVWLHHNFCAFDWKWIDQFDPNEIWWLPTERSLNCSPGARPLNFTG